MIDLDSEPSRVGYARVSAGEVEANTVGLRGQKDSLINAGCRRIYSEKIWPGSREWPQLEECLDSLQTDDTLVVWRLDRLGRSLKDLVQKLESLDARGVDFVSLAEGIDTTTDEVGLTYQIFRSLGQFQRARTKERKMQRKQVARERGKRGGRPRAIHEDDIPGLQVLMRDPDVSPSEICARFDVSRSTLYRYVGPDGERR